MKRFNFIFCFVFVLVLVGGCGKQGIKTGKYSEEEMAIIPLARRENLPEPSGGLVLSINSETITVDEVVGPMIEGLSKIDGKSNFARFSSQVKPVIGRVVVNKVTDMLIYQQAKRLAPENIDEQLEKFVEQSVNKFVVRYGGNVAKAEEAISQMGMDWDGFRDYQKKLILSQNYLRGELSDDRTITRREMLEYYDSVKAQQYQWDAKITFRLIDIAEDKVQRGVHESAKEALLRIAQEIIGRMENGDDFAKLAREYSNDFRAQDGGLWRPVTIGSLAEPYDVLEKVSEVMEAGDVSGAIEAQGHVFIMKLEEKRDAKYEPFEDVQEEVMTQLEFQRRKIKLDNMISKLMSQANIEGMEAFVDFCVRSAYHKCNQN